MSKTNPSTIEYFIAFISALLGIAIGFLFVSGLIPMITTAVWIAFAFAAAVLLLVPIAFLFANFSLCLCLFAKYLIIGAAGTFLIALAALAIVLTPASIPVAILIGLGGGFFSFLFLSFIAFLLCLADKSCCGAN